MLRNLIEYETVFIPRISFCKLHATKVFEDQSIYLCIPGYPAHQHNLSLVLTEPELLHGEYGEIYKVFRLAKIKGVAIVQFELIHNNQIETVLPDMQKYFWADQLFAVVLIDTCHKDTGKMRNLINTERSGQDLFRFPGDRMYICNAKIGKPVMSDTIFRIKWNI